MWRSFQEKESVHFSQVRFLPLIDKESVMSIFDHLDVPVKFHYLTNFKKDAEGIAHLKKFNTILKGPTIHHRELSHTEELSISRELDLYAYCVHAFSIPGVNTRHKNIDIVTIRERTEGEYMAIEHEIVPGVVQSIKAITKVKSDRIAKYAFDYAMAANRKKISVIHKANIMKLCDGQFLDSARMVAESYPQINYEEMIVDATCMNLSLKPNSFDVMLLPNLYGSIIGSVAAGLVGGAGIAPGANIGLNHSLFEQGARHAGEDLVAGRKANPTAYLFSSIMMLRSLKLPYFADVIEKALFLTLEQQKVRTLDIGGHNTTMEFTAEVIRNLRE